ncbi:fluoride efflux transporter FluC [uncultured Friedmanniella sp.]|uniref:fluoride efflux transporter FluC n=1 Tax=uncultured Friedmanniella sp. TaxID=335381 RepID=UPI0035C97C79
MIGVGVALAGGLGAVVRLVLDGALKAWTGGRYPVGTTVINLSGSLLLGLVVGLAGTVLPEPARLVLGTGFLGGYTTFSTAAVETVRLAAEHRRLAAWANGLGMLVAGVGLAALGFGAGLALAG